MAAMAVFPGAGPTEAAPTSSSGSSVVTRSHQLVAGFLRSQGYSVTLAAFEREAADALNQVDLLSPTETSTDLRAVVEDFLASRMQALAIPPAPLEDELLQLKLGRPLPTQIIKTVKDGTNVLTARGGVLPRRKWDGVAGQFIRCVPSDSVSS